MILQDNLTATDDVFSDENGYAGVDVGVWGIKNCPVLVIDGTGEGISVWVSIGSCWDDRSPIGFLAHNYICKSGLKKSGNVSVTSVHVNREDH